MHAVAVFLLMVASVSAARVRHQQRIIQPVPENDTFVTVPMEFVCPLTYCSECCGPDKGSKGSHFKCILRNPDELPVGRECWKPKRRTNEGNSFKTECNVLEGELNPPTKRCFSPNRFQKMFGAGKKAVTTTENPSDSDMEDVDESAETTTENPSDSDMEDVDESAETTTENPPDSDMEDVDESAETTTENPSDSDTEDVDESAETTTENPSDSDACAEFWEGVLPPDPHMDGNEPNISCAGQDAFISTVQHPNLDAKFFNLLAGKGKDLIAPPSFVKACNPYNTESFQWEIPRGECCGGKAQVITGFDLTGMGNDGRIFLKCIGADQGTTCHQRAHRMSFGMTGGWRLNKLNSMCKSGLKCQHDPEDSAYKCMPK
jgi:hypothetical protein